jgi:hypothetical protein
MSDKGKNYAYTYTVRVAVRRGVNGQQRITKVSGRINRIENITAELKTKKTTLQLTGMVDIAGTLSINSWGELTFTPAPEDDDVDDFERKLTANIVQIKENIHDV